MNPCFTILALPWDAACGKRLEVTFSKSGEEDKIIQKNITKHGDEMRDVPASAGITSYNALKMFAGRITLVESMDRL